MSGQGISSRVFAAAGIAAALLIAGCGSSGNGTKTSTISAGTAALQDKCVAEANPTPQCQKILAKALASNQDFVIKCGGSITTNTSCVFAHNVYNAFRHAEQANGSPPSSLVVTTNRVACFQFNGVLGGQWRCHSTKHPTWVDFSNG